jgi:tetratricopeptide (TPR) repeat protein
MTATITRDRQAIMPDDSAETDSNTGSDQQVLETTLEEAERFVEHGRFEEAASLAEQAANHPSATSDHQARAAIVCAASSLRSGDVAMARSWLSAAEALGATAVQLSSVRGDLERLAGAEQAIAGGIDASEIDSIVRAANGALHDSAPDQAEQLARSAWDSGQASDAQLGEIAIVIARATFVQGRVDEAAEWASYADEQQYEGAKELISDIKQFQTAVTASSDGVNRTEQRPVFEAAQEAFTRGDFTSARDLYGSVYDSPVLTATSRSAVAFNVAQCNRFVGEYELAKAWYEEYLRLAPNGPYVAEIAGKLEQLDTLSHLTDLLEVD